MISLSGGGAASGEGAEEEAEARAAARPAQAHLPRVGWRTSARRLPRRPRALPRRSDRPEGRPVQPPAPRPCRRAQGPRVHLPAPPPRQAAAASAREAPPARPRLPRLHGRQVRRRALVDQLGPTPLAAFSIRAPSRVRSSTQKSARLHGTVARMFVLGAHVTAHRSVGTACHAPSRQAVTRGDDSSLAFTGSVCPCSELQSTPHRLRRSIRS